MEAPDLIKPVVGFRSWRIKETKLFSWFNSSLWAPEVNEAHCPKATKHPQGSPFKTCGCGLYSSYQLSPAQKLNEGSCMTCQISPDNELYNYVFSGDTAYPVLGAALFWGRLEAHSEGMRAEFGRPVLLAYHPGCGQEHFKCIKEVAYAYGLPLVKLADLEDEASKLGSPLASELRPGITTRGAIYPEARV